MRRGRIGEGVWDGGVEPSFLLGRKRCGFAGGVGGINGNVE